MTVICGFVAFVYVKVIYAILTSVGISVVAALVYGIMFAGLTFGYNIAAGLAAGGWAGDDGNIRSGKSLPFSAIALQSLAFSLLTALAGHLAIIGFSAPLARLVARGIERGNFFASLLFAVPALGYVALFYLLNRARLREQANRYLRDIK